MTADSEANELAWAGGLDGLILLPRFIIRRADGLSVDISSLEARTGFAQFADQVFTANALLTELDYPLFSKLLYEPDSPGLQTAPGAGDIRRELRFARDIAPFTAERRELYRNVKIAEDGSSAEYFFEPLSVEQTVSEPVYGPPEADGSASILRYDTRAETVRARLDPDEFVAAMWTKGIRFGLDMKAVTAAIAGDGTGWVKVAGGKRCIPGKDASVKEQTNVLHRDDAPKILSNGRIDLTRFANHFPQVAAGARLLQKSPRTLGAPGFSVQGTVIEPEMPKDFEIDAVAGPGTRIERTAEGEFVVAAITGFVNIDAASNAISVSEKIVNRQGVSLRTTGDLALSGADFEEHGEVQERRQVKGHNMSFFAAVFGEVISDGGDVLLKDTLAGGAVHDPKGRVVIEKLASGATIEAKGGEVTIADAQGCLVIGSRVRIKKAVNCEILAEEVEVESCEACAVAGRKVKIGEAGSRRGIETVVTVFLPDNVILDQEIAVLRNKIEASGQARAAHEGVATQLSEQPEVKKFLALQRRVEAKEISMTAEQGIAWTAMQARFAPVTRHLDRLGAEILALINQELELVGQVTALEAEKTSAADESSCVLGNVTGETVVRTAKVASEGFPLEHLSAKELHQHLRVHGTVHDKVFSSSSGSLDWTGKDLKARSSQDV